MKSITLERNGKKTPFGIHGPLHVEGSRLLDCNNKICQLKGISSHSLIAFPDYINEALWTQLTDELNISLMRLAMYSAEADGFKGYSDGDDNRRLQLEELILKGVDIAAKLGLYVLVDWHILLDYDPNMHTDMAIAFFKKMCPLLKEYDNVIYEICNEPNVPTTWEQVKNYANQVIPVIRELDNDNVISVGTPTWSQDVDIASKSPLEFENLTYSLHFYSDSHRDNIRKKYLEALNNNLPIFVTEFGICDASGNGPINDKETDIWIELLNKNKTSYCIWNLSNKDESSAIIKPTCSKTKALAKEDYSECGLRLPKYMA